MVMADKGARVGATTGCARSGGGAIEPAEAPGAVCGGDASAERSGCSDPEGFTASGAGTREPDAFSPTDGALCLEDERGAADGCTGRRVRSLRDVAEEGWSFAVIIISGISRCMSNSNAHPLAFEREDDSE